MANKSKALLREKIVRSLRAQGFQIRKGKIFPPKLLSKDRIRELHQTAVRHRIERARKGLSRRETDLLRHFADGSQLNPLSIEPRLVEVLPNSTEELLFRYVSLHWSIPTSSGYGRRLRFLVIDENNQKVMGIIGLGDPVYSLAPRDTWVGWELSERKQRLRNVLDAFVLGAVPPYSLLLCGKLIAMLVASDTVRATFKRKYGGTESLIRQTAHDARLALVTTTSALGRSSIYNRLRFENRLLFEPVGFTKGSGEFQFSNGLYGAITEFALKHCKPTAKHKQWGSGFRNKREVVKKCLPVIGLSGEWLYHGIKREIFVVPFARNTREFLRGEHSRLMWYRCSETQIFEYFKDRWLLPRSQRDERYAEWRPEEWRLWSSKDDAN